MRKPLLTFCLLFLFLIPMLNAQVDLDELSGVGPVEFINFEGPYSRIDSRMQIRGIGYSLGEAVSGGTDRPGPLNRYFVIRSRSEEEGNKLNVDIFGLGVDTMVDHIRNLRLIIQGYLEGAYSYSERDAALLAQYITVYNAVYRGDMTFFDSRYRRPAMSYLSQERAGLALRFDEWPGQTLMLIPIGMGFGGPLSSIDTSSLLDPLVREQLRQEDGSGIDQRRDMVNLLEREADQASSIAVALRETAQEEADRIAREREEARRQEEAARQQMERAQREQEEIARLREDEASDLAALAEREAEAQRQLEEARQQEAEAQQWQDELDERQDFVDELRDMAALHEDFSEQKIEEAQEERQEIAMDQQAIIDQPVSRVAESETILGFSTTGTASTLGRLVRLDINNGREIARSPLSTINGRSIVRLDNRIFAIAGETRGGGVIRLVEINPQNLEMQNQGDDDIAVESTLWLNGQNLFAFISLRGSTYVARFNTNLVLQARSSVEVNPSGSIFFSANRITAQGTDGTAIMLNLDDLRVINQ